MFNSFKCSIYFWDISGRCGSVFSKFGGACDLAMYIKGFITNFYFLSRDMRLGKWMSMSIDGYCVWYTISCPHLGMELRGAEMNGTLS